MNSVMRSIFAYSYYDSNALDTSVGNSLRQCLELISVFPMFAAYAYHSYFCRLRYLFDHDGGDGVFEGLPSRRREFEIYQHDGRHPRARQRLVRPRRSCRLHLKKSSTRRRSTARVWFTAWGTRFTHSPTRANLSSRNTSRNSFARRELSTLISPCTKILKRLHPQFLPLPESSAGLLIAWKS